MSIAQPSQVREFTSLPSLPMRDTRFLAYLRGIAILGIVFGHVGGGWAFKPYGGFLNVFVPVFFFLSGAVSYHSYRRSSTVCDYARKRIVGILVPYYLLCLLSLAVYVVVNAKLPEVSAHNLLLWLSMRATDDLMPFPSGQVWFLHTLLIISLVSPIYFDLFHRSPWFLLVVTSLMIALSTVQLFQDVHGHFDVLGNNLYKPIVHSVFYILGAVSFSCNAIRRKSVLAALAAVCLGLSLALVLGLNLDVSYPSHAYSPDLYYLSGGVVAITVFLLMQDALLWVCDRIRLLANGLGFMHRYTYPIFLLHSFSIYISEEVFGLIHPTGNYIQYGAVKFGIVLALTCLLAIPFGRVSSWLSARVVQYCRFRSRRTVARLE